MGLASLTERRGRARRLAWLAPCLLATPASLLASEPAATRVAPRQEIVHEAYSLANGLFSIQPFKRLKSRRFMVLTDISDDETTRLIAGNLEATYDLLDSVFDTGPTPDNEANLFTVYVYRSRAQLVELAANLGAENPDGLFYPPLQLLAFHTQMHSRQALAQVMLHEATHAYLGHFVKPASGGIPLWFDEGFAEYVGTSGMSRGDLVLGEVPRKQRYRDARVAINVPSQAVLYAQLLKKSLRKEGRPTLGELLQADRETFYGEESGLYYAAAWMWVHFMRHGAADHASRRFPAFVEALRGGAPAAEALRSTYGELSVLEPKFLDYVRKFDP